MSEKAAAEIRDTYAEYRQGRVPFSRRIALAEAMLQQDGKMRAGVVGWLIVLAFVGWIAFQELHDTVTFGAREDSVVEVLTLLAASVVVILNVVRAARWRKAALRELQGDAVQQADGEIRWYRGRYAAVVGKERLRLVGGALDWQVTGRYRLFYLPQSRLLVAAEWSGEPLIGYAETLRLAQANGFDLLKLDANRRGRDKDWDSVALWSTLGFGAALLLISSARLVALLVGDVPRSISRAELVDVLLEDTFWQALAILIFFAVFAWPFGRRVNSVVGHVYRTTTPAVRGYFYYYQIGDLRFLVERAGWDALDERLTYRVYYRASSKRLLNMEVAHEDAAPAAPANERRVSR